MDGWMDGWVACDWAVGEWMDKNMSKWRDGLVEGWRMGEG